MPVGSSTTAGVIVGEASAYCVVVHRPAAAPQLPAKVQGGVLVFWIVILPLAEVMTAVSPGWVSSMHWKLVVQTRDGAVLQHHDASGRAATGCRAWCRARRWSQAPS